MNNQRKSWLLFISAAFLWSLGGLLIKSISWNPLAIAGMRSFIAAPLLLLVVRRDHLIFSFPQIAGALFYCATGILFVCANKLTTAANAVILHYTAPLYVALFGSWLLKEKVRRQDWIMMIFAISGISLFFIDEISWGNLWGNVLALGSGASFALMIVFLRMQKDGHPLSSVFLGNLFTVLLMVPFMFHAAPGNFDSWVFLFLAGTFQLGLAYILYSSAIKIATAMEGVMIPLIEPVLNPLWVLIFLGERPTKWAFIGGAVVILSLIIHAKMKVRQSADFHPSAAASKPWAKDIYQTGCAFAPVESDDSRLKAETAVCPDTNDTRR